MKKIFGILFISMLSAAAGAQNTGIGTSAPASSAILDISSTSKGLLIPRMSTAQRDGIVSPAVGLQIF